MTKRKIAYWVIPPEADAEFVACMEEAAAARCWMSTSSPTMPHIRSLLWTNSLCS